MRDPLLAPLAAIAAGILVSRFVPFETRELLIAIAAFLILGIVSFLLSSRKLAGACCLLGLFFAGTLADLVRRPGPAPELDAEGRELVILSGCVVQPPAIAGDRDRFVLELEPGARAQVTLYLRDGEPAPPLRYGQRVELEARVRRTRNFLNPGAFDYARYQARQDIYWTASAQSGLPIRILFGSCGNWFEGAIMRLRVAALDRLEKLYGSKPYETGMMQAILIGETSKMEKVWTEQFRSTGTFHALVISGTHVAVLTGFFLLLLRLCFVPHGTAMFLSVLAAWLYSLVTGWQAPCVRSAAGLTLFMIGRYFYRERRIMNLLAAVAIGYLVLDPQQMFEASFQLTFLSVAFIGAFSAPLLEYTALPLARGLSDLLDTGRDLHLPPKVAQFRVEMRLLAETITMWTGLSPRIGALLIVVPARILFYVFGLVVISAVIQIGLALPMIVYFHRVGFSGLSANAVVVPLMELVVPIGFVAIFTGWSWVAVLAGRLLAWSQIAVEWHARLEPNWRIPAPPTWLGVGISAALIAVALAERGSKVWRSAALASLAVLVAVLLWHPFPAVIEKNHLELTAIDVGQGDSLLVSFPAGKLMVIDGGGIPSFGRRTKSQLDIGEDVVSPYLWNRSIRYVDTLVLSHAHEDHIGGLPALLANFHVRELWTGATPECPSWKALRQKALNNGVKIIPLHRGQQFDYGGAHIRVLAPSPDYVPSQDPHNNDSLALRVDFGRHSFVLSGDIERRVEDEMLFENLVGKIDVLKVAHHGSKTSSSAEFLDAARPTFALISDGFENSYGHPHRDVLARLAEHGVRVFRTDQYGADLYR